MAKATKVVSEAEGYVAHWQEVLGLQNWRIVIDATDNRSSTSIAITCWAANYRRAEITINLSVNEKYFREENLSRSMLHELLHLIFAPLGDVAADEITGTAKRLLEIQEEVVVDTLANIIWRMARA